MEIEEENSAVGMIGFAGRRLRLERWLWGIQVLLPADRRCLPQGGPYEIALGVNGGIDAVVDRTPSLGDFDRNIVYQAGMSSNDSIVNQNTFQCSHCLDVPFLYSRMEHATTREIPSSHSTFSIVPFADERLAEWDCRHRPGHLIPPDGVKLRMATICRGGRIRLPVCLLQRERRAHAPGIL